MDLALKALESNKEDTQLAVDLWRDAVSELEIAKTNNEDILLKYNSLLELNSENEKRSNRRNTFINITIPALSLVPVGIGLLEYSRDRDLATKYLLTGIYCFVGFEGIYQGGKFILRLW